MNDFDELLNEVLRQDANPQPPFDMKKRLMDGLSIDATRSRSPSGRRRGVGIGIAAAILIGLTTWSLARIRPSVPAAKPVERVSLTTPGVLPKALGNREVGRPQAPENSLRRRAALVSPTAIRRQPSLEQNAVSIVPVAIESIAIQPIEIARLNIKKLSHER
jgi:hypothetical protein